jgi:Holliday junction DNA helicase RuvA
MMLSAMAPPEIIECIVSENAAKLKGIKGIGEKTALRLIVELKNKLKKNVGSVVTGNQSQNKEQASAALLTLGFAKNSVDKILDDLIRSNGSSFSIEELIKEALKRL